MESWIEFSKRDDLPTLSILILTYNCAQNLKTCLQRIRDQNYPKDKIEIHIMDGGSEDETCAIAKSFGANIAISDVVYRDNAEERRYIGMKCAKNEIIANIESDIFLPHNNWILEMVKPLVEDNSIVGTQTLRYSYLKNESILDRYCALFGISDPVVFYLNKADRISWAQDVHKLQGTMLEEHNTYYKMKFNYKKLPTLGANGFLIRKSILDKIDFDPNYFFHIDITYDLARLGYDTYGIVKNDVIHMQGDSVLTHLKKRLKYMVIFHQQYYQNRRYLTYDKSKTEDNLNLIKYIIYSITFIKPLYDGSKGFVKIRDVAWFLHPLMCLSFLLIYTYGTLLNLKRKDNE